VCWTNFLTTHTNRACGRVGVARGFSEPRSSGRLFLVALFRLDFLYAHRIASVRENLQVLIIVTGTKAGTSVKSSNIPSISH